MATLGDMNQKSQLRIQLSAIQRGARLARLLTERQLDEWDVPFGEAAQVVAELASNAVLHGRVSGRDFRLGLKLHDDGTLRIEVTDARGDRIPRIQDPAAGDAETAGGYGSWRRTRTVGAWTRRPRTARRCGPNSYRDARVAAGHDPVVPDAKDQRTGERAEPTPTAPVDHPPE